VDAQGKTVASIWYSMIEFNCKQLCGCPRKTKQSCLIANNANLIIHCLDEREHQVACMWRPLLEFYQAREPNWTRSPHAIIFGKKNENMTRITSPSPSLNKKIGVLIILDLH